MALARSAGAALTRPHPIIRQAGTIKGETRCPAYLAQLDVAVDLGRCDLDLHVSSRGWLPARKACATAGEWARTAREYRNRLANKTTRCRLLRCLSPRARAARHPVAIACCAALVHALNSRGTD